MSIEFATHVVQQLVHAGYTAYWAGGCVRDTLLGKNPQDYDVATSATPEQVRQVFGPRRSLPVGESFGVIIVLGPKGSGHSVEVATFRREGNYLDGRRPTSVEFCSAREDASRRDFTINGMFFDPISNTVHDYVGGEADLRAKVIRAIGDARARMTEDKLRMLRAVRFTAALEFSLEEETAQAIREMSSEVRVVSAERIAQELRKMLAGRQRSQAMQLFAELGLMEVLLPEVHQSTSSNAERWSERLQVLDQLGESEFSLAFACLLRDVPAPTQHSVHDSEMYGTVYRVCRRLRLSNDETDRICWLNEQQVPLDQLPERSLAQIKRLVVHPGFRELLQLEQTIAQVTGKPDSPYQWIDDFLARTPVEEINPPQLVTGKDLLSLGLTSGPNFKNWLTAIRDAQLNNAISTREEAIEMAKQLASQG
ncbi:CCA tRNA nucleotidyltransferase [Planctomicrobium sp. SH661]|uniref:CCA tRNA nucleotidyltransferase n=1 Tax=Planctomicrobium sp. SH661 TaxID=3448124 RepID=UPI003F5B29DB